MERVTTSCPMPPLVHHPAYDANSVPDGHRFPMRKYSLLADRLRQAGASFHVPDLARQEIIAQAHTPDYVQAVFNQTLDKKAARQIGFEITPAITRRSRAAVGGTLLAAQLALKTGSAVNLAGGSHHAGPEGGAGFCVFNDVGIAARALLEAGRVARVAVIDLDVHHGDGTALIFAGDDRVSTLSVHCENNWPRVKPPSTLDVGLDRDTGDDAYLAALGPALVTILDDSRPDLVFYNAGVDPHADDRLGLLSLTDSGLYRRDRMVVDACRARGVPVCGVLGGGYGHDADAVAKRHLLLVQAMDA